VIELEAPATGDEPTRHSETFDAGWPVPAWLDQGVLVAVDDAATASPLVDAVRADGLRLVRTAEAGDVLPLCRRERPSLLLADRRPDFSRGVLSPNAPHLAVLPVRGVDWSDLGHPERVLARRGTMAAPWVEVASPYGLATAVAV
jgi:hypothetical protein